MNGPPLRSEVFLREDIRNLLRALDRAGAVLERIPARDAALYRAGYRAALQACGVAFDVDLGQPLAEVSTWRLSLSA